MNEDLKALLDRADRAIVESKRLAEESTALVMENRRLLEFLIWEAAPLVSINSRSATLI